MLGSTAHRVVRFGAAAGIAAIGFLGFSQAAHAAIDPYPTVTTEVTTTTGPSVLPTEVTRPAPTTAPVAVEDNNLARTGSDSGKIALLGLAALGAGGVCVSAARRRSAES